MNRDFIDWLARERMPMFDICCVCDGTRWNGMGGELEAYLPCPEEEEYEVWQKTPEKRLRFLCNLDELLPLIQKHFPALRSAVAEVAIRAAIEDLRLRPWWQTAGPMTEEIRYLLREGIKHLPMYLKPYGAIANQQFDRTKQPPPTAKGIIRD